MFISFLHLFRATMCPSSEEVTVFIRQLVLVILYGWLTGMHTGHSSIQSDKYQVSHRHSYLSWWWAHCRPKQVEKRNKHTKKNCAPGWNYLQDYKVVSFYTSIPVRIRERHLKKLNFVEPAATVFIVYRGRNWKSPDEVPRLKPQPW